MKFPRSEQQRAQSVKAASLGRVAQTRDREGRMEDYLFIGGDKLSARQAAARLGVTPRTITRYRKYLREAS